MYYMYTQEAGPALSKRSILTKVPPWVKWSMQKSPAATLRDQRPSGLMMADDPSGGLQYDRNTRDIGAGVLDTRQTAGAILGETSAQASGSNNGAPSGQISVSGGARSSNLVCFFNPVSCFGRRPTKKAWMWRGRAHEITLVNLITVDGSLVHNFFIRIVRNLGCPLINLLTGETDWSRLSLRFPNVLEHFMLGIMWVIVHSAGSIIEPLGFNA